MENIICPVCHLPVEDPDAQFCDRCGSLLSQSARGNRSAHSKLRRKVVTMIFIFTGMVAFGLFVQKPPKESRSLNPIKHERVRQKSRKPRTNTNISRQWYELEPEYTILNKKLAFFEAKKQYTVDVLVSDNLSKYELKTILRGLTNKIKKEDPLARPIYSAPLHLAVYAYTSKDVEKNERQMSNKQFWAARLIDIEGADNPYVEINKVFGLSEGERKEVFTEIWIAEEEEKLNGDPLEEYKDKVAEKHGLTRQQLDKIMFEGTLEVWFDPMKYH